MLPPAAIDDYKRLVLDSFAVVKRRVGSPIVSEGVLAKSTLPDGRVSDTVRFLLNFPFSITGKIITIKL
jgi:hypothetical protein